MVFASNGWLEVSRGNRDRVVQILTRANADIGNAGCLLYEVGVSDDEPTKVFVSELWESADAHRNSLSLDSVRAAIAEAMPLLTGDMGGHRFDVVGSPLR